jgi:hypothetical protein
MPDDDDQRSSFWVTMPGIITALAGLVSAVAVLVGALYASGVIGSKSEPSPSPIGTDTTSPGASGSPSVPATSPPTILAQSDSATIHGTFQFNFDTGVETGTGADVWWQQQTDTERQLVPRQGARLVNLGQVDFGAVSLPELRGRTYTETPINGDDNSSNVLTVGDVFAVLTDQGNHAKAQVAQYGYDLVVRFVTYQG